MHSNVAIKGQSYMIAWTARRTFTVFFFLVNPAKDGQILTSRFFFLLIKKLDFIFFWKKETSPEEICIIEKFLLV